MREVVATSEGPKAIGPYSQAIKANGLVFVSGQVAIDPPLSRSSRAVWPRKPIVP